jgi:uncharacterized protein YbjT (DUF2867 family)
MSRILIIGATGTVGRQVASQLASAGGKARALVRQPDAARLPAEIGVACGDLTVPETLDRSLKGVDTVFLVWTAPPAAVAPALERIASHADRIVFLSAPFKAQHPLFQQPNPSRALAEQIERLIESSGLQWTFLRPGMFAQTPYAGGHPRFALETSCVGRTSQLLRRPLTSVTSPRSPFAPCLRTGMRELNTF